MLTSGWAIWQYVRDSTILLIIKDMSSIINEWWLMAAEGATLMAALASAIKTTMQIKFHANPTEAWFLRPDAELPSVKHWDGWTSSWHASVFYRKDLNLSELELFSERLTYTQVSSMNQYFERITFWPKERNQSWLNGSCLIIWQNEKTDELLVIYLIQFLSWQMSNFTLNLNLEESLTFLGIIG